VAILPGELPPGRTKTTNATKALRTDLEGAYKGTRRVQNNVDALHQTIINGGFPGTITVNDPYGNTVTQTDTIVLPLGLEVAPGTGTATITQLPFYPFDYDVIAFTAMNIGGSNEVERVRTLADFASWDDACITCSATSDSNGFSLEAQYFDTNLVAWTGLGVVLDFPASQDIDTGGGFQQGDFSTFTEAAVVQGLSATRIAIFSGSVADDIYGLHLVMRRVHRI
jgi:hypothetical protein